MKYGEDIAILAGDALLSTAFEHVAKHAGSKIFKSRAGNNNNHSSSSSSVFQSTSHVLLIIIATRFEKSTHDECVDVEYVAKHDCCEYDEDDSREECIIRRQETYKEKEEESCISKTSSKA